MLNQRYTNTFVLSQIINKAMASKKFTLLTALFTLIITCTFAQKSNKTKDWGWDWKDSSKVPTKRIPQFNEFLHNQFPYPAKPRDQFEVGLDFGYAYLFSDLDTRFGYFGGHEAINIGGGIHIRKSLSPTWSVRGAYTGAVTYGLDYRPRYAVAPVNVGSIGSNPWKNYYTDKGLPYFANFRNKMHALSLDLVYSLNTLDFFRANPKWNLYLFGGYTLTMAEIAVDALDSKGHPYYWTTDKNDSRVDPYGNKYRYINILTSRGDIRTQLSNILDNTYEEKAGFYDGKRNNITLIKNNWLLRHGVDFGFGFSYKINDLWNVGLEQKLIYAWEDMWDGVKEGNNNDMLGLTSLHINRNFGNSAKKVQPLWWINPYNFIYNELNVPAHIKIPTPKLPDADNDGVTDQFDLEPNTPAGTAVDARGRSLDSDGDGIPDSKDKELLTPQKCFPVNADGVGTCPDAACCAKIDALQSQVDSLKNGKFPHHKDTIIESLPSIQFKNGSIISGTATKLLESVAEKMKANPDYRVKVIGHPLASKVSQQRTWEKVHATIKYLSESLGISENRFIFALDGGTGDPNTVDLQFTTEDGPNTIAAPFPNLKK